MKTIQDLRVSELRKLLKIKERMEKLESKARKLFSPKKSSQQLREIKIKTAPHSWSTKSKKKLSRAMKRVWKNKRNGVGV